MAILGYIVYMIVTLFTTVLAVSVWSWPGSGKGEGLFLLAVSGLFWYGAYYFCPFSVAFT